MNTRWLHLGFLCSLMILGGNLLAGVDDPPVKGSAPAEVQVSQPLAREVTDYEDFTGRIEPIESVELRTRVTGYIDKVTFKPGTIVKRGDVLFEIDPRPYKAVLDQADAEVKLGEARLRLATTTFERTKALLDKGVVSKEELNNNIADREVALANLDAAKARREVAHLNLEFTRIIAPITGRISRPFLTAGNLVRMDETTLGSIASTDPVYVFFNVDERTYQRLVRLLRDGKLKAENKTQLPVQMGLSDDEGFPHQGKLDFVDGQVNRATETISCRAIFTNADEKFLPGMFARVRLATSVPHKALLVAEQAVMSDQGQSYLYVVTDKNVVERRTVKLGAKHGNLRVVTEGLTAGEWVIVKGHLGVEPGKTVKPEKTAMPGAEKPSATGNK